MNSKKTFKLIISDSSSTSSIEEDKIKSNKKKNDQNKKNISKIKKLLTNYIIEDNEKHNVKDDSEKIFNLCMIPKKQNDSNISSVDSDLIDFINT